MGQADSMPLRGAWVSLHEVTGFGGEVVDSQRVGTDGTVRLRAPRTDTTASYLLSVEHQSIAYFSEPFRGASPRPATILVYDTSAVSPIIATRERHIIFQPMDDDGTRRVIELLVLENAGRRTRVAPDTSRPVWEDRLLPGVVRFEVGAADVSEEAVYRRGDRIAVAAPIPPGERQVLVSYVLPRGARELDLSFERPIMRLNVMVADSLASVGAPTTFRGREMLEGVGYQRYAAEALPAGARVTLTWGVVPRSDRPTLIVLVSLAVVFLIGSGSFWWRRTVRAVPRSGDDDAEALAARIAALDRQFGLSPTETYRAERAALKARLVHALARRQQPK